MNRAITLEEKQAVTRELIRIEKENLNRGFNPVTKEYENNGNTVNELTPFQNALRLSRNKVKVSASMMSLIDDSLRLVEDPAKKHNIAGKSISAAHWIRTLGKF